MNYACYMTWYLRNVEHLPTAANSDLLKGAHVCRHSDGGTAGRRDGGTAGRQCQPTNSENRHASGKGRVQAGGGACISTKAEHLAVWVGSFSVCAQFDLAIER